VSIINIIGENFGIVFIRITKFIGEDYNNLDEKNKGKHSISESRTEG